MELNSVRPFLTKALDHLHQLRTNITRGSAAAAANTQAD